MLTFLSSERELGHGRHLGSGPGVGVRLHLLPALAGEVVLGAVVDLVYLAFIRPCQGGVASPVLGGGAARPHLATVAWLQRWKVTDLTGTKE
jgi:hypothetical protein